MNRSHRLALLALSLSLPLVACEDNQAASASLTAKDPSSSPAERSLVGTTFAGVRWGMTPSDAATAFASHSYTVATPAQADHPAVSSQYLKPAAGGSDPSVFTVFVHDSLAAVQVVFPVAADRHAMESYASLRDALERKFGAPVSAAEQAFEAYQDAVSKRMFEEPSLRQELMQIWAEDAARVVPSELPLIIDPGFPQVAWLVSGPAAAEMVRLYPAEDGRRVVVSYESNAWQAVRDSAIAADARQ